MQMLKDTEKAYIAGIIDGEGSIMLIRNNPNKHPSPYFSVASSTIELLEYLKLTIGHGQIKAKKNYDTDHHLDSFTYVLRGQKVIALLDQVSEYLIIDTKKARSKLLIEEYNKVTMRNGRYTPTQLNKKHNFYDKFISIK